MRGGSERGNRREKWMGRPREASVLQKLGTHLHLGSDCIRVRTYAGAPAAGRDPELQSRAEKN